MSDNVRVFMPKGVGARVSEQISFEQFCIADVSAKWLSRTALPNGMIVLTYPRCVMVCCGDGACTAVRQIGARIEPYFDAVLAALDEVA